MLRLTFGSRFVWNLSISMACGREGSVMVRKMWERLLWEGVWPYVDPWDSVRLRTASTQWNVPRKYGPHGEGDGASGRGCSLQCLSFSVCLVIVTFFLKCDCIALWCGFFSTCVLVAFDTSCCSKLDGRADASSAASAMHMSERSGGRQGNSRISYGHQFA